MTDFPEAAMIFAAGFGTRMGDLTRDLPKPMVPLAGRPMFDHAFDLATSAGVKRIVANTHYLPDRIEPHLKTLGVKVLRETPDILETGGGLKAALPHLGDAPVYTLNPDAAWRGPNPLNCLREAWRPTMNALLLLVPLNKDDGSRSTGDFSLEQGEISRNGPFVYTGAQILRTGELARIPDRAFSLNRYWDHLAGIGPLHGILYPGEWRDIGTPEGLFSAEAMLNDV